MRTPLDLSSATAKLERAQFHAQKLLECIRVWSHDDKDPAIRVGLKDDLKNRRTLAYAEGTKDVPPSWSLILGDAVHDYRSALNYVAGALILCGAKPEVFDDPDATFQFPIDETTRQRFFRSVRNSQLPGVKTKHLRVVSTFQPYKRRSRWVLPAIKRLNDLDKHRKPLLTTHYVAGQMLANPFVYGTPAAQTTMQTLRPRDPVKPGTKLAYVIWPGDERPNIIVPPHDFVGKADVTVHFRAVPTIVLEDLPQTRSVVSFVEGADGLLDEVLRKLTEV